MRSAQMGFNILMALWTVSRLSITGQRFVSWLITDRMMALGYVSWPWKAVSGVSGKAKERVFVFVIMQHAADSEAPQLLLYTSSNKTHWIGNHSHWSTNIISARCDWPQLRGQLANDGALHCFRVCRALLLWCVCIGVRVGMGVGVGGATSILKPTKQDDFIVFPFHCPSPFRDVIC